MTAANTSIIDRDLSFYQASLETETRIMRSCRGGSDEYIAKDCQTAAEEVLKALQRYRLALHIAGRIE
jgi:hypothetical protein